MFSASNVPHNWPNQSINKQGNYCPLSPSAVRVMHLTSRHFWALVLTPLPQEPHFRDLNSHVPFTQREYVVHLEGHWNKQSILKYCDSGSVFSSLSSWTGSPWKAGLQTGAGVSGSRCHCGFLVGGGGSAPRASGREGLRRNPGSRLWTGISGPFERRDL